MKLKCLIVDDEPIARQIVEGYCGHLAEMVVVGSCGSALEAKQAIESRAVDLVFLDINMPILDGMAFVRTLRNPPQIIFTTAYKEFAHEAFDLHACDYLLKPFSLERFIVAIDKVKERIKKTIPEAHEETALFIKADGVLHKISPGEILFAEAKGNHVKIVLERGSLEPAMTFTSFEELLPADRFIRLHRSFLINRSKITRIEGNRVFIGSAAIPVGASYRSAFFAGIGVKKEL